MTSRWERRLKGALFASFLAIGGQAGYLPAQAQTTTQATSTPASNPIVAPAPAATPPPIAPTPTRPLATPSSTPTTTTPIVHKLAKPAGHATTTHSTTIPTTSNPVAPVIPQAQSEIGAARVPGGTVNPFGFWMYALAFMFFAGAVGFIIYGARLQRKKKVKEKEGINEILPKGPCEAAKLALAQKTAEATAVASHITTQEKLIEVIYAQTTQSAETKIESVKTEVKTKIVEGVRRRVFEADESGILQNSTELAEDAKAAYDELVAKKEQAEKLMATLKDTYRSLVTEQDTLQTAYQTCLLSEEGADAAKRAGATYGSVPLLESKNLFIERTIDVSASPASIWRVFADKSVSRKMGGEYVTDWKVGSPFGWRGAKGEIYTKGTILDIVPGTRLEHTLVVPDEEKHLDMLYSTISYQLTEKGAKTELFVREEFVHAVDDEEYHEVKKTWDEALLKVKEIAENLSN